jgi:hypothetical protein
MEYHQLYVENSIFYLLVEIVFFRIRVGFAHEAQLLVFKEGKPHVTRVSCHLAMYITR